MRVHRRVQGCLRAQARRGKVASFRGGGEVRGLARRGGGGEGKTRTLDRLIATTAAAGGNDEAARELALSQAEERAAAIAAERAAPAPNSPESIADAAERIERTPAEKIGANDVVDVLRRFAGARAVVPPRVSKHIDAAAPGPP